MATRRRYQQDPHRNQEGVETDVPPPPPPQQNTGSGWLRTTLTIAVSAVVGAIAVDFYKRYFSKTRNEGDDGEYQGHIGPMGALPGAPSIMPMPMPMPIPWPMGGGFGFGQPVAPQGYRDERPLTDEQKLELQRLKTEEAKAKAMEAQWEAWENEDID
jgi:hypothetical protein